ncbi:MAG TPA: nucleoside diphosphate kinase regulator [Candidatus Cloacimonadota bacterium]|jgi:regulator of nucleoside diphosphate kinase|nr:nucleoside diphosphate kinase regulator [Candidatus Cloacimonadota bacterium]HOD53833.1 nucleoside diphosphate kinase regulator [Candidatus Cloacimonadota bacterium]HPM02022.1 nucleoside diphosphate kinase regulator [Candidatus Cloacimonadota bacterium]
MVELIISLNDKLRLDAVLNQEHVQDVNAIALRKELNKAKVLPLQDVPSDVISMESTVTLLDLQSGLEKVIALVYPDEADYKEGKISVLAPIGTALIGYRQGDEIEWKMPGGVKQFKVIKVEKKQHES